MIIDAMDILYSGNCDGFVLVSSDSDFTRLAIRLREAGMKVYGMGSARLPSPLSWPVTSSSISRSSGRRPEGGRQQAEDDAPAPRPSLRSPQKEGRKNAGIPDDVAELIAESVEDVCGEGRLCPHGQAEQPADEEAARLRSPKLRLLKLSKLIKSMGRFDWKTEGADNSEYFVRDTQRADK